jgi:tetratricopeptide (TPR) repeat protein
MEGATRTDVVDAGTLAAKLKDGKACREIFQAGLPRFPDSVGWLNYGFGSALRQIEADEEAVAYFRAARQNPAGLRIGASFIGLADALKAVGKVEDAWEVYEDLVALDDATVNDLTSAGYFGAQHGHPEVRAIFEKAASKAKDTTEKEQVRRMEGWALLNLGSHEDAVHAFEQARHEAESDSKDKIEITEDLLAGLAIATQLNGKTEVAQTHYRALIAKNGKWGDPKTIAELKWPEKEKSPMEQVRKAVGADGSGPALKP